MLYEDWEDFDDYTDIEFLIQHWIAYEQDKVIWYKEWDIDYDGVELEVRE